MDAAIAEPPLPDGMRKSGQKSLSRRVLAGGAWSLAGRIGSMGSLFALNVVLARSLGPEGYAPFLPAASVVPVLAMLATMGVPMTLIRVVRGSSDPERRRLALRGAAMATIVGCLFATVVFVAAHGIIPAGVEWRVLRDHQGLVAAWFCMSALCMMAANFLQAEDDFRSAALVGARSGGLIPNVLALLAALGLAAAGMLTLDAALWMHVLAYLCALGAAAWLIARALRRSSHDSERGVLAKSAGPPSASWFLGESWPNLLNQLIAVALNELDIVWVARLTDADTLANYGAVRHLRLLVAAPLMVASIALPPFVAELYARGELKRLERLVRAAATALSIPSLIVLAVLLAAPALVLRFTFGAEYETAATALQFMAIGAVTFVLTGSNAMTLTMVGRHRELLVCSISGLVFYLVISPPLVARYGVSGAAAAYALQTIALNVAMTLRVRQLVGIWTIPLLSWKAVREEWLDVTQAD
jgi:O-antigen/teichoic acid export membrane protein